MARGRPPRPIGPQPPIGSTVTPSSVVNSPVPVPSTGTSSGTPISFSETVTEESIPKDIPNDIPKEAPKKSYSQVLKNSSKGMNLSFVPPKIGTTITIEEDDIAKELEYWQTTLVGTVLGKHSTLVQIETLVSKYWTHITTPEVMYFAKGWYHFRFASAEDMEKIRSNTWNVNRFPLVFKPWSPTVIDELTVYHVPIWVLFPSLDPCFWSNTALSKVASLIGNPICADEHTTNKSKLAFARVLVDVDLSKELPKAVQINSPYRGTLLQKVEYEWIPHFCSVCKRVGHSKERCNTANPKPKPKVAYKPKPVAKAKVFGALQSDSLLEPNELDSVGLEGDPLIVCLPGEEVFSQQDMDVQVTHNNDCQPNGRILVFWRETSVSLTVLSKSAQHIHCHLLQLATQQQYEVIFVYAFNTRLERRVLWQQLSDISSVVSNPWVCMGDFNVVLNMDERLGSDHLHLADMNEFGSCLDNNGLVDHPATGNYFTWNNKQGDGLRWAKLDRVLTNQFWIREISSTVAFLEAGVSGHSPGLVTVLDQARGLRKNFKYMNCWASSPQFLPCVEENWPAGTSGGKIYSLFQKLKQLKKPLSGLHSSSFTGLADRVKTAKTALLSCQSQLIEAPQDPALLLQEKQLLHAYTHIKRAEMLAL
ncbi:uncharacterized protein LOC141629634 [Silene latifolia]|uniref:uncharacterized protein LOC141629634 n=1 Tax=Silene latifolia TaxID=37657 RepID=UPI003D777B97